MILNDANERIEGMHANARVLPGVASGNIQRGIGAAIVGDHVFPVGIGLLQHTLNTLLQVSLSIIYGSENGYQGFHR